MKYYLEIELDDHYPTAKELAILLGINGVHGEPSVTLIRKYCNNNKLKYAGRKGMTNVYSDYQKILSLANDILVRCTDDKRSEVYYSVDGRGFNLVVNKEQLRKGIEIIKEKHKSIIDKLN